MEDPLSERAIYGARVAKGTIQNINTCNPAPVTQGGNGFQLTERYVLGPGGEELTMLDGSGAWQRTNVLAGGRQLATYDIAANPAYTATNGQPATAPALHFQLVDALGTRRMQTNADGQPETDIQSLPYGDGLVTANDQYAPVTADDATPLHFTGKERDAESGNDYFGARYYASTMGRFLIPDWSAKAEPVPYARLDNPQTLNLYAYLQNNPLAGIDADGHCAKADETTCAKITQDMWRKNMDAGGAMAAEAPQVTAKVHGKSVTYNYPDGTEVVRSGTHPFRDNNPGDLTGGHGSIGRDGSFAIYGTEDSGWSALQATLTGKYANSTIAETMNAFNPPDNGKDPMTKGNDPVNYAATLASAIGVSVTTKISSLTPAQLTTVMANIGKAEGYNASGNSASLKNPPSQ